MRFRWRGRAYRITHVNGVWSDIKGRSKDYHYHVVTKESGSFELIYNNLDLSWKIGWVCLEK